MKIQLHTTCIGTPAKTGVQSALVLKFAYSINAFREVLQVHYQGMRISENRKKIQDSTGVIRATGYVTGYGYGG